MDKALVDILVPEYVLAVFRLTSPTWKLPISLQPFYKPYPVGDGEDCFIRVPEKIVSIMILEGTIQLDSRANFYHISDTTLVSMIRNFKVNMSNLAKLVEDYNAK